MAVQCRRFVWVEQPEEVPQMVSEGMFVDSFFILAGGSNVLFTKNYEGTIFHPVFKGIQVLSEDQNQALLRVAAGEEWGDLVEYCVSRKLYGLENLIGIPGLVGSAPVQNIGAYGVEVKDCIHSVEGYFVTDGQTFSLSNEQCRFCYRDSVFKGNLKGRCFITYVTFRLSKKENYTLSYKALSDALERSQMTVTLKNVSDMVAQVRNSKLPDVSKIGCAGSFFKNPVVQKEVWEKLSSRFPDLVSYPVDEDTVKLAAGQLIEKAGWKGRRVGNAGVYPKQALVVVNFGEAQPDEVTYVYKQVIADVHDMFGIMLVPEVNIL